MVVETEVGGSVEEVKVEEEMVVEAGMVGVGMAVVAAKEAEG